METDAGIDPENALEGRRHFDCRLRRTVFFCFLFHTAHSFFVVVFFNVLVNVQGAEPPFCFFFMFW